METVKFGRIKIKVGDCVSVPSYYFGDDYLQALQASGITDDRIYGRVTKVTNGNSSFVVKWDLDQEEITTSLDKVQHEAVDTPLQRQATATSVITAQDFEGLAGDLEQGSGADAAQDHALLVENNLLEECTHSSEITTDHHSTSQNSVPFTLFMGNGRTKQDCLVASLVPCDSGVVHNKKMKPNEAKFLIHEVINMWNEFDSDLHGPGAYVVWDMDHCVAGDEGEEEEKKSEKMKKRKEEEKKSEKMKKRKEEEKKSEKMKKRKESEPPGKTFRKKLGKICAECGSEEDELTEKTRNTRKRREQEYEESDEEDEFEKKTRDRKKRKEKEDVESDEEDELIEKKKTMKRKGKGVVKEKEGYKDQEKKKAKPRKTRMVRAKVIMGKKAADKVREKNKNKDNKFEEENVLDYEEVANEEEEELSLIEKEKKRKAELEKWKVEGGWKVNPRVRAVPGPHLIDTSAELFDENSFLDYFFTFFPVDYVNDVMLPATNKFAVDNGWQDPPFTYEEFIRFLGLLYMMEVVHLPERRMYWRTTTNGLFPALNFGKVMALHRFERFLNIWQLSDSDDMDQQVLDFIDAVNDKLKTSMRAGEVLCVDESMIKAYHRNLNGKMKIIRKPRPIGNELKTVSDATTNIVLHMELHESKEDMADKEHVNEFGATTACCLRITEHWRGSGKIVVGDSWFGSVKSCVELWNKNGLYSIMLVKTAHKNFPRELLRESDIERGEWVCATAEFHGLKVMATRFLDLQEKMFISSCSTSLNGPPRVTKHHGDIPRPQVAFDYLTNSASIDIHNHFRTGSKGLEDVWQTKNASMRQVAGVLGFLFTNAYLGYRHFEKSVMRHSEFKIELSNALCQFRGDIQRTKRHIPSSAGSLIEAQRVHVLKVLEKPDIDGVPQEKKNNRYQKMCYYCQHNPAKAPVERKTSWHCDGCVGPNGQVYPLCDPRTGRNCFALHLANGLPHKRRYTDVKNKY